jgi:hypothetical protein
MSVVDQMLKKYNLGTNEDVTQALREVMQATQNMVERLFLAAK